MKSRFILLLLSILFATLCYAKGEESLDQSLAIVNEDVITKSEVKSTMAMVKKQMMQAEATIPSEDILQKQVLDQLINKKLQLQVAKQSGIQISDAELNQAIENVAKQNHLSVTELYQRLSQEGLSKTEYRNELREQLTLQKLQQQELGRRINVSADEVSKFMRAKVWQGNGVTEYRVEDILIPFSDKPSSKDVTQLKKTAEVVLTKLKQGQTLPDIIKTYASQLKLEDNDLGWRKLPEMPALFTQSVTQLKLHDFSNPIEAPNGFHILRLADRRVIGAQTITPTREQAQEVLLQRKFEEAVKTWVSKLRNQAFIVTNPNQ